MELDPTPFECGGSGVADSARNLVRTIERGQGAQEGARHAALRRHLAGAALRIAEAWRTESPSPDRDRSLAYHSAVWKLRGLAVDLAAAASEAPHGVHAALRAFTEHFLPSALLLLRPAGILNIVLRDHLRPFQERLSALGLLQEETDKDFPGQVLAVRYPQGEQDNVLMACTALPYFHMPRQSHVFATAQGGPAYFFAVAAEIQNNRGFSEKIELARLCFVGELLEISGWVEHPEIGPLIETWRRHFGFGPRYLDEHIPNASTLRSMREMQEAYRSRSDAYAPDDFDRDVPAVWARLSNGMPFDGPDDAVRIPRVITVMNAGWSFVQRHMDGFYARSGCSTPVERYDARQRLNALLARSIERKDV